MSRMSIYQHIESTDDVKTVMRNAIDDIVQGSLPICLRCDEKKEAKLMSISNSLPKLPVNIPKYGGSFCTLLEG